MRVDFRPYNLARTLIIVAQHLPDMSETTYIQMTKELKSGLEELHQYNCPKLYQIVQEEILMGMILADA